MARQKRPQQSTRVLIAGESWVTHSIHQKGFDSFTTTEYVEGVHLRAWMTDSRGVNLRSCLNVGIQLCHALDAIHSAGKGRQKKFDV